MMNLNVPLVALLYLLLFFSLLLLWRTKSYHWPLSFLIFGELVAVTVVKAPALVLLSFFVAHLFMSRWKLNEEIVTTRNTILFGLIGTSLAVLSAFIFCWTGLGYFLSISLALGFVYFAVIFLPNTIRERAVHLWKASLAVLAPLALFEVRSSVIFIPLIIVHYFLTVLWIKDLVKTENNQGVNSK